MEEEGQKGKVCALILLIKRRAKKSAKCVEKCYFFFKCSCKSPKQVANKIVL